MTPNRRSLRSYLAALALSLAVVALLPVAAWAQSKKPADKQPTPEELKGYTLPYFFTAIGVLAVTMSVTWPANRKWDLKVVKEE